MPYYNIDNNSYKVGSINNNFYRLKMHYFCKLVNNDKDYIICLAFSIGLNRQTSDKIYQEVFLLMNRN